jgi:hypothetical protein
MYPNTHNIIFPVYLRQAYKTSGGKFDQKLIATLGTFKEPGA